MLKLETNNDMKNDNFFHILHIFRFEDYILLVYRCNGIKISKQS